MYESNGNKILKHLHTVLVFHPVCSSVFDLFLLFVPHFLEDMYIASCECIAYVVFKPIILGEHRQKTSENKENKGKHLEQTYRKNMQSSLKKGANRPNVKVLFAQPSPAHQFSCTFDQLACAFPFSLSVPFPTRFPCTCFFFSILCLIFAMLSLFYVLARDWLTPGISGPMKSPFQLLNHFLPIFCSFSFVFARTPAQGPGGSLCFSCLHFFIENFVYFCIVYSYVVLPEPRCRSPPPCLQFQLISLVFV